MAEQCEYGPKPSYEETVRDASPTPDLHWQYEPGNLDASYAYDYGSTSSGYDASLADLLAAVRRAMPPGKA